MKGYTDMKNYRLPLSKSIPFCNEKFYELLSEAKSLGFEAIDFDIAGAWSTPDIEDEYFLHLEEGMAAVIESGLPVNCIHIPFGDRWNPCLHDEDARRAVVEKFRAIIARTAPLKPLGYIVHGSFEPNFDDEREAKIAQLVKSMREMADATDAYLCIEILPRTCLMNTAAEAKRIIEEIGIDNVRVCVDVNHFLQEKSEDGVLALGNLIVTTHISDHDYENERHWMPGKGKINWNALIGAFEKIGYKGVFNYELGAPLADIKENYKILFDAYNASKD
ncbi:MAG: sugar phosphate isomerase/epimerase [Clostridia bacterium]|nr:sugar phosphate isomerase/epimerase [Clostridia bacterium]